MSRRTLLRAAGGMAGTLALGKCALARRLLLVATGPTAPISQVEWIVYDTGLRDLADERVRRCAVRVTTTDGAQGWSDFASWTAPDAQAAQLIKDILRGQDPADHEDLWQQLYRQGVSLGTLGAVDIALWDLRGRIEGQPVHALLGTKRQKVAGYVSTGFNLGELAAYAEFATACKAKGIRGVKVQPGGESPEQDLAVYVAVRDAVGSEFTCIAGGAATYTLEQALTVGRTLDELGYAWFQSPMPENDAWVGRYATLAAELQTPICAPEADPGSYESRLTWLGRGACDIPCIDVHHGGLTACVQLALACESQGVPLELRNIGPDAYAHLQLAGASGEPLLRYVELLSSSQESSTLPGRATPESVFDEQGYIAIGQTPGLGIELDWQYIFTHRVG